MHAWIALHSSSGPAPRSFLLLATFPGQSLCFIGKSSYFCKQSTTFSCCNYFSISIIRGIPEKEESASHPTLLLLVKMRCPKFQNLLFFQPSTICLLICYMFKLECKRRKWRNLRPAKLWKFSKNGAFSWKPKKVQEMIGESSTSPSGGNQVDGLPPAPVGIGLAGTWQTNERI